MEHKVLTLIKDMEEARDYLIAQLAGTYDTDEQNRLIGRVYQQLQLIEKLYELVGVTDEQQY